MTHVLRKLLLSDPRVDPNVAFRSAVLGGHSELVKRLLSDHRVDPNWYVIHEAERGYEVDPKWAITSAEENGHSELLEVLLSDPRVYSGRMPNSTI